MSIYSKLSKVQNELKAPKGQWNKFGNYAFRSCEDITEAVKPLLSDNGLMMTITDDLKLIGDRYYIKATVTVIDTETSEKHEVSSYAREAEDKKGMDVSQITGATSSYARKYALNGMFAIDDTKDADSTNKHGKDEKNTSDNNSDSSHSDNVITNETKQRIQNLINKATELAGDKFDSKQIKTQMCKDFAKEKNWKAFYLSDKTKESMASQFVEYLEKRLNGNQGK